MLIGYARVSTNDQNPALQIDALKAAGCERLFVEKASGAQRDRPELAAALAFARRGDQVVVWKLDRLARSLGNLLATTMSLETAGVELRSLTENLDTSTPGGRLVFHLFGALAEFERAIIRERTLAGLATARAMGRKGGRPRALNDNQKLVAQTLLANPRLTAEDVAGQVGVSLSTLYRYFPKARSNVTYVAPSAWTV